MVFVNKATQTAADFAIRWSEELRLWSRNELSDLGIGEFVNKKLIRVA
jgi:hypothetical protein